jgi:tyrosine-protein kinase Etk/Wzc
MQGFAAGSPRVVALGEKLGAVRAQITQQYSQFASPAGAIDGVSRVQGHFSRIAELQPELVRLRAATAALTSVALAYDGELRSIPTRERALARLTRDVEVDRQVHALLAQRYEEARIQEAGRLSTVGLVDEPRLGVRVRPNYRNDAVMALLLGLLLAFGTVFAVDYFDTTVRRPEDLERQGFSVLASVPRIEAETGTARACAAGRQAGRPALVGTASGFPISGREPDSTVAEAFRVLRTNLQFGFAAERGKQGLSGAARSYGGEATSDAGSPGNCPQFPERGAVSVIVTSPGAGEGKSLVASNLATVMAQSGKRTLLVDCDLRRPKQHKLFERRKKPGLTDVVMLGTPLEAALFSASSMPDASGIMPDGDEKGAGCLERQAASALHVIFAGTTPPSPVDFLNSSAFESFLKQAAGRYDCVVIDTPPVLVSADAAVLASKATGVVLVARMRTTDWRALAEAKKLLAQAGARVLGVVANELRLSRGYGYYRYKYRYYNYRYQTHNA